MSLQDIDDLESAVLGAARLLTTSGRFCIAIVHPINSSGSFDGERGDPPGWFVIPGSYLETCRYHDDVERDGLAMSFHSEHRPLQAYSADLERAGLGIEAIREVTVDDRGDRWARIHCSYTSGRGLASDH